MVEHGEHRHKHGVVHHAHVFSQASKGFTVGADGKTEENLLDMVEPDVSW